MLGIGISALDDALKEASEKGLLKRRVWNNQLFLRPLCPITADEAIGSKATTATKPPNAMRPGTATEPPNANGNDQDKNTNSPGQNHQTTATEPPNATPLSPVHPSTEEPAHPLPRSINGGSTHATEDGMSNANLATRPNKLDDSDYRRRRVVGDSRDGKTPETIAAETGLPLANVTEILAQERRENEERQARRFGVE
jgi:hypothetical protein